MNPVSMKQQREIMLSMMTYIDSVCTENEIQYSLSGGTLLGAARHHGFIPWDDDMDVMLLRDQYDKLIQIMKKDIDAPYRLIDVTDKGNPYAFAKICDSRTFRRGPLNEIPEMGIFIDIFPIDYLPDDAQERRRFLTAMKQKQQDLNFYSMRTYNKATKYYKKVLKSVLFLPKFVYFRLTKSERDDKTWLVNQMSSYDHTETVGFTGSQYAPEKEFFPVEWFSQYARLTFENRSFSVIAGYDGYLKQLYGDYMEMPPVALRVNHSYYKWYWAS